MTQSNENNRELLPGGILGFLVRRWLIILVPFVLLPVVSYLNSVRQLPVYCSTARLLVRESNLRSPLLDSYVLNLDLDAQLSTLGKTALRPIILNKVRERVALGDSVDAIRVPDDLADHLEIHIASDGGVTLEATAGSPEAARHLAHAFQDICIGELNRPRVEAAEKIMQFLAAEFDQAQSNLNQSHQHLSSYRASHGKVLPELEAITYNLLLSLEAEQVTLDAQSHALVEKRKHLEADPAVRGQTVAGLMEQIDRLENDLVAGTDKMTDNHPDLQIMRARLSRLKLDLTLRQQGLTPPGNKKSLTPAEESYHLLLIEQEALAERMVQVDSRVDELQQKIATASNHDAEYVRRMRDVESHTEIYLDLLRRRERAATSRHLVAKNHGDLVRVLSSASLPQTPDSPRPIMELLVGIFSGLLVGMGLAVGAEMTDRRLFGSRNLEVVLGAPTLLVLDEMN